MVARLWRRTAAPDDVLRSSLTIARLQKTTSGGEPRGFADSLKVMAYGARFPNCDASPKSWDGLEVSFRRSSGPKRPNPTRNGESVAVVEKGAANVGACAAENGGVACDDIAVP